MMYLAYLFTGLAAFIHFYIFVVESLLWGKPRTNKVFRITPEQAEQNRQFAFNQGFYNLFLAIAAAAGSILCATGTITIGFTLMAYATLSMLAAALVLICSQRNLIRAALIQGLPPLLALICLFAIARISF